MSGGREVDVKRGGAQLPKQHTGPSIWALYRIFGLQTLAWWKLLVLIGKNSFSSLLRIYLNIGPSLPTSTSRPLTWWMLPGLPRFSPVFRSHVLLWTLTEGKNGGGLGTRLSNAQFVFRQQEFFLPIFMPIEFNLNRLYAMDAYTYHHGTMHYTR